MIVSRNLFMMNLLNKIVSNLHPRLCQFFWHFSLHLERKKIISDFLSNKHTVLRKICKVHKISNFSVHFLRNKQALKKRNRHESGNHGPQIGLVGGVQSDSRQTTRPLIKPLANCSDWVRAPPLFECRKCANQP